MQWFVLYNNINARNIEKYDIFKHGGFAKDVNKLLKQSLTKQDFAEKLRREVQYYFWGRCEMEQVMCSWPVYIDDDELTRVNEEYETYNAKYGHYPYTVNVDPDVCKKICIYDQVMLNFDVFCDYVWKQKEETI